MRLSGPTRLAVFALLAACHRASTAPSLAPDAAVTTTASEIDLDAGFVSAAAELAAPAGDAGAAAARGLVTGGAPPRTVPIPAGTFASGSTPGDEGRDAAFEPARAAASLGAYAIDALPYPNDPSVAPRLVASSEEASKLCAAAGPDTRLCTELEWEHACAGPEGDPFATGSTWNPLCDQTPSACASGFGVRAMGFLPEWTDSRFARRADDGESPRAAARARADGSVVRGATAHVRGAKDVPHRCAARGGSERSSRRTTAEAAFRCCHGDRNGAVVAPIDVKPAFRRATLDAEALARVFADIPELGRIREGVRLFSDAELKSGIVERAAATTDGIAFSTTPIFWSPAPGMELLVASGRAKKTGFVVALWTWRDGANAADDDPDRDPETRRYRLASSFLLLNDPAPVALAWEPGKRKSLLWTSCFGCTGEQGAVRVRDDGRVVIVQY